MRRRPLIWIIMRLLCHYEVPFIKFWTISVISKAILSKGKAHMEPVVYTESSEKELTSQGGSNMLHPLPPREVTSTSKVVWANGSAGFHADRDAVNTFQREDSPRIGGLLPVLFFLILPKAAPERTPSSIRVVGRSWLDLTYNTGMILIAAEGVLINLL